MDIDLLSKMVKELILDANKAASAGVTGRGIDIRPEKMLDIELGYEYVSERLSLSANLYMRHSRAFPKVWSRGQASTMKEAR